ncbi:hypothetical protein SMICM304S_09950 [Streptomyces microflavus]
MSTDFDSFSNRGEYLSAFYFAEQLGDGLKKGVFATWANRESDEHDPRPTPRESVRTLRSTYLDEKYRGFFAEQAKADEQDDEYPEAAAFEARLNTYGDEEWCERVQDWHRQVLAALGFPSVSAEPTARTLTVHRAGREHEVTVAWHSDGIVALDCGWSASNDTALDADGYGRLLHPLRAGSGESSETGQALATWLFQSELGEEGGAAPRFVLLLRVAASSSSPTGMPGARVATSPPTSTPPWSATIAVSTANSPQSRACSATTYSHRPRTANRRPLTRWSRRPATTRSESPESCAKDSRSPSRSSPTRS